jgi:hypothetical protein
MIRVVFLLLLSVSVFGQTKFRYGVRTEQAGDEPRVLSIEQGFLCTSCFFYEGHEPLGIDTSEITYRIEGGQLINVRKNCIDYIADSTLLLIFAKSDSTKLFREKFLTRVPRRPTLKINGKYPVDYPEKLTPNQLKRLELSINDPHNFEYICPYDNYWKVDRTVYTLTRGHKTVVIGGMSSVQGAVKKGDRMLIEVALSRTLYDGTVKSLPLKFVTAIDIK